MNSVKLETFALPLLRFGMVALFLWFGLSQITNPGAWIAWVPAWVENFGLSPTLVVIANGLFETVFGALLAAGYYTRVAALLLALHLLFIAYEVGYNDIGVRDFALAIATLSLALFKPDQFTLDNRWQKEYRPTDG